MQNTDSELLQTLLLGFERAMLVSRCGDGLRARPMAVAQTRDTKRLWLLSGIVGDSLEDLAEDPSVNVVLQDGSRFCSVAGVAKVARPARGSTAPGRANLALIQVTPHFAEYWDRTGPNGVRFEAPEAGGDTSASVGSAQRSGWPPVLEGEWCTPRAGAADRSNVIPLERARWKR
jgi:general stress protein 26